MAIANAEIARLSVRVLPDLSRFRKELKVELEKIVKNTSVKIAVKGVFNAVQLRREVADTVKKINAENQTMPSRLIRFRSAIDTPSDPRISQNHSVRIQAVLDRQSLTRVRQELEHWVRSISPLQVAIHPNMSSLANRLASARLSFLARPRIVSFKPKVDMKAWLAAFTILEALAGVRSVRKLATDFFDMAKNMDKAAFATSLWSGALFGALAGLTQLSMDIVSVGRGLAQILPLALALPGALVGIGIAAGITVVAMKDIKKAMPELVKLFEQFRKNISKNFWDGATAGLTIFTNGILKQFMARMVETSRIVGNFWGNLASSVNSVLGGGPLNTMFKDLNSSLSILTGGNMALANIIKVLGVAGSQLLPRLAGWFVRMEKTFSSWLNKVSKSGQLQAWIDQAIVRMHELWRVLAGIWKFFANLARAADSAGAATLGSLANRLERLDKVMSGAAFQGGLVTFFKAVNVSMDNIANGSGAKLTKMFENLAKMTDIALPMIGNAVGNLIGGLASAFGSPAFLNGFIQFSAGFEKAMVILQPGLLALGQLFGSWFALMGTMMANFAPLWNVLLVTLGNVMDAVTPTIQTLIGVLAGAFLRALQALAPYIETALVWGVTKFAEAITWAVPYVESFAKTLLTFAQDNAPRVVGALASIKDALGGFGDQFRAFFDALPIDRIDNLATVLSTGGLIAGLSGLGGPIGIAISALTLLKNNFDDVLNAAKEVGKAGKIAAPDIGSELGKSVDILGNGIQSALGPIIGIIGNIVSAIVPLIAPLLGLINELLAPIFEVLGPALTELGTKVKPALDSLVKAIVPVLEALKPAAHVIGTILGGAIVILIGVIGVVVQAVGRLGSVLKGVWDIIVGFAGILVGIYEGIMTNDWSAMGDGFKLIWEGIKSIFSGLWGIFTDVLAFFDDLFGVDTLGSVEKFFSSLWGGIMSAWNSVLAWLENIPTAIGNFFTNVGTWLMETGSNLINGLWNGITTAWNAVIAWFSGIGSAIGNFFINAGTWLYSVGMDIINGVNNGIVNAWNAVTEWFAGVHDRVVGFLIDAAVWLIQAGNGIINGLKSGIDNGWNVVSGWFKALPDAIISALGDLAMILFETGKKVLGGFLDGLKAGYKWVEDSLNELTDMLPDWKGPAHKDATLLTNAGQLIMGGFLNGLESQYGAIKDSLGGFTDDLSKSMSGANIGAGLLSNVPKANVSLGAIAGEGNAANVGSKSTVFNYYAQPTTVMPQDDLFRAGERMKMAGIF